MLAHMLLFAFMLRALIPVGYMPDVRALSVGELNIVICHGSGDSTIVPFDLGKPSHENGSHASQPCAFAAFHMTAEPSLGVVIAKPDYGAASHLKFNHLAAIPPARAGPVLGSRGPPSIV